MYLWCFNPHLLWIWSYELCTCWNEHLKRCRLNLGLKKKKSHFYFKKWTPGFMNQLQIRKYKTIQRKNPVMKCVLSRCLFSDDFVVYRSFVMLTTDFTEVLSSLSNILLSFTRYFLWLRQYCGGTTDLYFLWYECKMHRLHSMLFEAWRLSPLSWSGKQGI